MSEGGALAGLRVLDLSRVLAGPFCAMILGDHGADVVKVEPPEGDETRTWGPPFQSGTAAYYLSINRNKRGIALDLRRPEAREVVLRLADRADVLIENFKLGTMERWGLGYEEVLFRRNPRLIYCNISGFGRSGPYAGLPGYDAIAQAMGGVMSLNGTPEQPMKVGMAVADLSTGMFAAIGILVALEARRRTGRGQRVDCSLLDSQVALLTSYAGNYFASGKRPARYGSGHPNVVPYNLFPTADRPLYLAVGNDRQFRKLCEIIGRPDLADDPRFATNAARSQNRDALEPELAAALRARTADEWMRELMGAGVPAGPLNHVDEVAADPHVLARGMVRELHHPDIEGFRTLGIPVRLGETAGSIRRHPPRLGEHNREVLGELGYSAAEIERLLADGAVIDAWTSR